MRHCELPNDRSTGGARVSAGDPSVWATRWLRQGVAINAASRLLKASTDGAFPDRCGLPPSGSASGSDELPAGLALVIGQAVGREHDHERVRSKAKVAWPCLWPAMT